MGSDDKAVQRKAIETLRNEIRTATSSMTSVPKPLKFLREHYGTLAAANATVHADNKVHDALCACSAL